MTNFQLGNEMWKVNWSTWYEWGTNKQSEFPAGIEPWTSEHRTTALSSELQELIDSNVI